MSVTALPTPNPNAMKFQIGVSVGGPATFVAGGETDDGLANDLLQIEGVASLFKTADFVTITKAPAGSWEIITPEATRILESHFPA